MRSFGGRTQVVKQQALGEAHETIFTETQSILLGGRASPRRLDGSSDGAGAADENQPFDGMPGKFSQVDLNFPTAVAFIGDRHNFKVLVLESGHGLPSRCNDRTDPAYGGPFSPTNPFTPDIVVLDKNGNIARDKNGKPIGPFAKPTGPDNGFQADGPAIDIAFENRGKGGSED
ncbi:MAG: hypothetical protein E6H63_00725, partial [Betaproteobacteria bacterium]